MLHSPFRLVKPESRHIIGKKILYFDHLTPLITVFILIGAQSLI
jgi:hypothetical protein